MPRPEKLPPARRQWCYCCSLHPRPDSAVTLWASARRPAAAHSRHARLPARRPETRRPTCQYSSVSSAFTDAAARTLELAISDLTSSNRELGNSCVWLKPGVVPGSAQGGTLPETSFKRNSQIHRRRFFPRCGENSRSPRFSHVEPREMRHDDQNRPAAHLEPTTAVLERDGRRGSASYRTWDARRRYATRLTYKLRIVRYDFGDCPRADSARPRFNRCSFNVRLSAP